MAKMKQKELVRDGFLGDLPEEIQLKIMNIHKLVVSTCGEVWEDKNYDSIRNQEWAKSAIDDFCRQPSDNDIIGSVRVYKQGKRHSCMIQVTGHFLNHRNDIDHELLHDFIRHVHHDMRTKVRRQFDMRLTCESEHGEPFEGFDVWTSTKTAKAIWELFEDKKAKPIKPMKENTEETICYQERMFAEMHELPDGLQEFIENINDDIINIIAESSAEIACDMLANSTGDVTLYRNNDHLYGGYITVNECEIPKSKKLVNQILKECKVTDDSTKALVVNESSNTRSFVITLDSEYAGKLWNYLENIDPEVFEEKSHGRGYHKESYEDDINPFMEADNMKPEYNTDMSEAEAKRTLKTISQNIINDISKKSSYRVSQYTANIYANIITKNLLPIWATGFRKVTITITDDKSNTLEFKVPKMTQDFVSRFIRGRESINGFIHRNPEINIRISSRVFNTIQNPDDAFNFFKAAIKYYNSGLEKYSEKLMFETMKLNHEMKHLISTTKLSGIVTCPMQLLFVFDDVDMSNRDTFKISQQDIKTVNQFIRNIYTRYAAPEKEKKQIVDDVNEMIRTLKESCDGSDENIRQLTYLPEAVNDYLFGNFESTITDYDERWMTEQFDMDWIHNQKNPQVKYLQEKFGVKKLKKIPADLIAYITIETEAIKDANDKMMISSYCLSKLEIVEWYIELLEVGSKKYIVPHTKPYLESVRTQLLACFKNIMAVKIVNPTTRPIIDIQYPKGYEG